MIMNKFKSIFLGLEIAYGQYQPGERGSNGKQQGKAFIVRQNVTDELWTNHLVGGGVLILTNITLIILASLKVFGIINFLS